MSLTGVFLSMRGRINRGDFWYGSLVVWSAFVVLYLALRRVGLAPLTWVLYPPLFWSQAAIAVKRYHDIGRSGWWLLLIAIPIIGPAWMLFSLGFRRSQPSM